MDSKNKISAPWGKLLKDDCGRWRQHHLIHHMMDVASCFEALVRMPVFYDKLCDAAGRILTTADISRLSVMVYLHDIGKIAPAFQYKKFDPKSQAQHASDGMSIVMQAFDNEESPLHGLISDLLNMGGKNQVLKGFIHIFAHHGQPVPFHYFDNAIFDIPALSYDVDQHMLDMVLRIRSWFPAMNEATGELPDSDQFWHCVNGLVCLADHLGSNKHWFPFVPKLDENYAASARQKTRGILQHIGIDPTKYVVQDTSPKTIIGFDTPNPAQAAMYDINMDEKVVILESETGSGKTEAALIRYILLYAAGLVSGMYFAVPTRSAAKQLHSRLVTASKRIFGEQSYPEPILAIPGYIKMGDAQGQREAGFEVDWNDAKNDGSRWACERADRFLAAKIAVGTVDQAMLSALQTKHAHFRGSALLKNLLVIDEIHASDPYMTAVIECLVDAHTGMGGYTLMMSATLGSVARARWLKTKQPSFGEAVNDPYPAIWESQNPFPTTVDDTQKCKEIRMHQIHTMDADRIANIAAYHASRGARVLVVRNTVNAAQEVVRELTDTGAGDLLMSISGLPALHHSRFAAEDRERLDAEIERILATDVNREKRGYIAVGTQTLEQSLDIDADILITDLCPIDVLLQRLGRLHRKFGMPRKAEYADPRAIVCVPQEGIDYLSEPRYKNGLGGWIDEETNKLEGNYIDIVCLELTRRLIDTDPIWEIPKMNRYLVEKATHPDMHKKLLKEKGRGWINYYKLMRTRFSTEKRSASIVVLDRNIPLPEAYGARPGTRLGEIGATLKFPRGTKSPFGGFINQITLPEHWSKYIEDFAPVTITQVNETTFIMEVETLGGGAVSFLYNNLGLQILTQG